jgi:hypothetical protein
VFPRSISLSHLALIALSLLAVALLTDVNLEKLWLEEYEHGEQVTRVYFTPSSAGLGFTISRKIALVFGSSLICLCMKQVLVVGLWWRTSTLDPQGKQEALHSHEFGHRP